MREAVERLHRGFSPSLPEELRKLLENISTEDFDALISALRKQLTMSSVIERSMPLRDAIGLAVFLGEATLGYVRFTPWAETVAAPLELATITKHEGFKWVRRGYFYDQRLNPDPDETSKAEPVDSGGGGQAGAGPEAMSPA